MPNGSIPSTDRPAVRPGGDVDTSRRVVRDSARELAANHPFVFLVPALAAVVLARLLPNLVKQDTWLALTAGRLVWDHGLPHEETLTVWAQGREWIDQQWLGQLALYGLEAAGGLQLVGLVHVSLIVLTIAVALAFALRSGATSRSAAAVGAVGLFVAMANTVVRTQALAYLLFVLVLWLLASDDRSPSRRVLLVLPLLVLWANVHGSALLGFGLVALWALAAFIRAGRSPGLGPTRTRAALITLAALVCLVASPYLFDLPGYYRDILGAGAFRDLVSEWRPATLTHDWPFFALALPALWLAANRARRLSVFEHAVLLFTFVAALGAIRNIVWFALVTMMVIPRALDAVWVGKDAPIRRRVNVALSLTAVVVTLVALALAAARPTDSYTASFPAGAARAVERAAGADPSLRIFANERFADWLLWESTELEGRVAFDARFELLTDSELREIASFRRREGLDWRAAADGYRLLVLDSKRERGVIRSFRREPGIRVLFRDPDVTVLLRSRR